MTKNSVTLIFRNKITIPTRMMNGKVWKTIKEPKTYIRVLSEKLSKLSSELFKPISQPSNQSVKANRTCPMIIPQNASYEPYTIKIQPRL